MNGGRAPRAALTAIAFWLCSGPAGAVLYEGELWFGSYSTPAERAQGVPAFVSVGVRWRLAVLVGEPVVLCEAAHLFAPGVVKVSGVEIPEEVLREVRLIRGTLEVPVVRAGETNSLLRLRCDLGAFARPFFGTRESFQQRSKEERARHFSFNVPGSPPWAKLFFVVPAGTFIDEERAKAAMRGGVRLENLGLYGAPRLVDREYDTSSVRLYLWEKEREALEREREREMQRRLARRGGGPTAGAEGQDRGTAERASDVDAARFWTSPERANASEEERAQAARRFWQRPANETTLDDEKWDEAYGARRAALDEKRRAIERDAAEAAALLAALRRELEARPPPGGPRLPAFDKERKVQPVPYPTVGGLSYISSRMHAIEAFWDKGRYVDLRTGWTATLGALGVPGAYVMDASGRRVLISRDRRIVLHAHFVLFPAEGRWEARSHFGTPLSLAPEGDRYVAFEHRTLRLVDVRGGHVLATIGPTPDDARCGITLNDWFRDRMDVELVGRGAMRFGSCLRSAETGRILIERGRERCAFLVEEEGVLALCLPPRHQASSAPTTGAQLLSFDAGHRLVERRDLTLPVPAREEGPSQLWRSASGRKLLAHFEDALLALDPAGGQAQEVARGFLTFAPALDVVAVSYRHAGERASGTIVLLEATTGKVLREVAPPPCERPEPIGVSPDGQHLAWSCFDGYLLVREDPPPR